MRKREKWLEEHTKARAREKRQFRKVDFEVHRKRLFKLASKTGLFNCTDMKTKFVPIGPGGFACRMWSLEVKTKRGLAHLCPVHGILEPVQMKGQKRETALQYLTRYVGNREVAKELIDRLIMLNSTVTMRPQ